MLFHQRIMLVLLLYSYLSEINNENPELMSLLEKRFINNVWIYNTNRQVNLVMIIIMV